MTAGRIGMALAGVGAILAIALTVRSTTGGAPAPAQAGMNYDVTFKDMDGRDVSLTAFKGQPLVINLWAAWCGPCRLEMPQLVDLYARYKDRGLVVIGISLDDSPEEIRAFAKEFSVTYPMLVGLDHPAVLQALGYTGAVPMTIFVKPDGTIHERVTGIATTASMERRMLALLE